MERQTVEHYYVCPICGSNNSNQYLRCNRPDCTDGRDPRKIDDEGLEYNYTRKVTRVLYGTVSREN